MSEPRWTLGPWRLGDDATGKALTIWAAEPGVCITSVFDNRMGDDTPPMSQAKANARLIASAPELYEALAGLLDVLNEYVGWRNTATHEPRETTAENKARAALAKARGEG